MKDIHNNAKGKKNENIWNNLNNKKEKYIFKKNEKEIHNVKKMSEKATNMNK